MNHPEEDAFQLPLEIKECAEESWLDRDLRELQAAARKVEGPNKEYVDRDWDCFLDLCNPSIIVQLIEVYYQYRGLCK